jgi:hypothetical protein
VCVFVCVYVFACVYSAAEEKWRAALQGLRNFLVHCFVCLRSHFLAVPLPISVSLSPLLSLSAACVYMCVYVCIYVSVMHLLIGW